MKKIVTAVGDIMNCSARNIISTIASDIKNNYHATNGETLKTFNNK